MVEKSGRPYDPNRVRAQMCKSCPWRKESLLADLRPYLEGRSLQENRYCHQQQLEDKEPDILCRGSRNMQLEAFHQMGVLSEPTDECWATTLAALTHDPNSN